MLENIVKYSASGSGTAGTVMAVRSLLTEKKKLRRLDSNLRVRYRMATPSGSPKLGTSKRSSSDFFEPSSTQSRDEKIEASQFSIYNYGDT